jgi:hypothetical protein
MISPIYNISNNTWQLHPYKVYIKQDYIDTRSVDIIKAFVYSETGEMLSDSTIEAMRSI